jgi:hypothetical protein
MTFQIKSKTSFNFQLFLNKISLNLNLFQRRNQSSQSFLSKTELIIINNILNSNENKSYSNSNL